MTAYGILVIFLSLFLGIFLILAIAATVMIMKLIKRVNGVVDKATHTIKSVEDLADTIRSATGASVLAGLGAKMWRLFNKSRTKKR